MRLRFVTLVFATALGPSLRAALEESLPEHCTVVAKIASFPDFRTKWRTNPASSATAPYFDYLAPMFDNLRQSGGGIPGGMLLTPATSDAFTGEIVAAVVTKNAAGRAGFVLVAKTGLDEAALQKHFAACGCFVTRDDEVRGESTVAETKDTPDGALHAVTFKTRDGDGSRYAWMLAGDTLVAGSEATVRDVVARLRSPGPDNFTRAAVFAKAKTELRNADAWLLVDGEPLGDLAGKAAAAFDEEAKEAGGTAFDKAALLRSMHLERLTGYRATFTFAEDHVALRSAIGWTAKEGLFAMITPVPGKNADIVPFVAGAQSFGIDRSDIGARYRAIAAIARTSTPFVRQLLENYPDQLAKAGVDVRGGFFDNLGEGFVGRTVNRPVPQLPGDHADEKEDDYASSGIPLFLYNSRKPNKSSLQFGLPWTPYSETFFELKDGAKAAALLATLDKGTRARNAPWFAVRERQGIPVYSLNDLPANPTLNWIVGVFCPKHFVVSGNTLAASTEFEFSPASRSGAMVIGNMTTRSADALADDLASPVKRAPEQPGLARALALLPASRHALTYDTCGVTWTKYAKNYAGAFNSAVRAAGDDAPLIPVSAAPKAESVRVAEVSASSVEDDELVTRTVFVRTDSPTR